MGAHITIGSLFSGVGGLELGLHAGLESRGHSVRTLWQVEQNSYCRDVLARHWPHARRYEDVRDITRDNAEPVHILCGGFPCQDISVAGHQAGLDGARSGLFYEMSRIVRDLRPKVWIMENVSNLVVLGLSDVLREVADCGYHARWGCLRASDVGAPHHRNRWFCVAWNVADSSEIRGTNGQEFGVVRGESQNFEGTEIPTGGGSEILHAGSPRAGGGGKTVAYSNKERSQGEQQTRATEGTIVRSNRARLSWEAQSGVGGDAYGFPAWLDIAGHRWPVPPGPQPPGEPPRLHHRRSADKQRLMALGNAVVPQQILPVALWVADNLIAVDK